MKTTNTDERTTAASAESTGSVLECQGCKWWQADDEDDKDNTGGKCRRYPPTVKAATWGNYFFLVKSASTYWPDADAFDYCGEHTPNNQALPQGGARKGNDEQ